MSGPKPLRPSPAAVFLDGWHLGNRWRAQLRRDATAGLYAARGALLHTMGKADRLGEPAAHMAIATAVAAVDDALEELGSS